MKMMSYTLCVALGVNIANLTPAFANDLNLTTGTAKVIDATSVALQNLSLDGQYFNAVIQLNLDGTYQVLSAEQLQLAATANYTVTFESDWSAETHPYQYPSSLSHFSGLIGATHRSDYKFWERNGLSTPGVEQMAETGGKSELIGEIEAAIATADVEFLLSGGGIGTSPGSVSFSFEVTQGYPFASLVSMIAPSPDWFVGVSGLSLIENGQWLDEVVIPLFAYDAGTDDGVSYLSANSDTVPRSEITRLEELPFIVDGEMPPLGRFVFRRVLAEIN